MDGLTRQLIDENDRMRRALTAISAGHKAGSDFLIWLGAPNIPMPTSLIEGLALAERVASEALKVQPLSQETINIGSLRRMLKLYGQHQETCVSHPIRYGACDCGWAGVRASLDADILSPNG